MFHYLEPHWDLSLSVRKYKFLTISRSCLFFLLFSRQASFYTSSPKASTRSQKPRPFIRFLHISVSSFHHSQPTSHRIAHGIFPISYHRHQTFKHGSYQRRHLSPAQPTWLECLQSSRGEHSSLQSTLRCRKRDFSQVTSYGVIWKQQQQHHHQRHSTTFSNTSDYRRQRRPRS